MVRSHSHKNQEGNMDFLRHSHIDDIESRSETRREESLRKGWRFATILIFISVFILTFAYLKILDANLSVEVRFVRIDGVVVQEKYDIRREVLMDNIRQRNNLSVEEIDDGE